MPLTKLNATQGLTGTLPAVSGANLTGISAGKVLQVVSTTDNTEISNTTGTTAYNYSQLNTSITPSATSSKIFVQVHFGCLQYGGNDSSLGYGKVMYTVGGGSDTDLPSGLLGANNVAGSQKMQFGVNLETQEWQAFQPSMAFLHSPSTTSALVYKVMFWAEGSSGNIKINKSYRDNSNDYSAVANMTCMEIEG
tara:strand:+ start:34 stop:615 length:582 start_codon:yes stop_codon:yes gene_type:complete